jgi:beta-galactosidase GanA
MRYGRLVVSTLAWLGALAVGGQSAAGSAAPHLERRGQTTQLIVEGRPFLVLGGEVLNNSSMSLDHMAPLWPRLEALHLNTVLTPVSWAMFEPEQGRFDYTLIDGLIRDARAHDLRLVLLWFGSWKNTTSSYAPVWVKRDLDRFPRVRLRNGLGTERLSPFSQTCREADARAFAALMRRVKEIDGEAHTVIMVQVENEVGMVPDARDHAPVANQAYEGPVPQELMDYLLEHRDELHPGLRQRWLAAGSRSSGNWQIVFGPGPETEDLFMAWHFGRYIGKVAEAGKAQYDLPMFTNAALIRGSYAAGQYNSGGPLAHSMDVWKAAAPQLDFLASSVSTPPSGFRPLPSTGWTVPTAVVPSSPEATRS